MKYIFTIIKLLFVSASLLFVGMIAFVYYLLHIESKNIKTTISVEADGKIYTGSAVQKISCKVQMTSLAMPGGCDVSGEAIPVKIGNRGYLFMLLSGPHEVGYNPAYYWGSLAKNNIKKAKSWDVDLKDAPAMVAFSDLNDPKTIKAVYPVDKEVVDHYVSFRPHPYSAPEEKPIMKIRPSNIAEIYGEGVSLKSIHVEYSKEEVTLWQIEKIIFWVIRYNGKNLNKESGSNQFEGSGLADLIMAYNFKSGI